MEFIMSNNKKLDECPFTPGMGTINASGVIKNLNGSSLSVTEIFLRETVQNSYDARLSTNNPTTGKKEKLPLDFSIRAYSFSKEQFSNLKFMLSNSENENSYFKENVEPNFDEKMVNIEVSDLNTSGLIGDFEPSAKTGNQNFTNFVYFTGNDKQKETGSGGSYGFGKAALFLYSQARTIAVYTRIKSVNGFSSRFIIISNDERIKDSNCDRCWWGVKTARKNKDDGSYAAPVLNEEADELAKSLGMKVFDSTQSGTRVLLLNAGPDKLPMDQYNNPMSIEQIFHDLLPKYILHWYWNRINLKKIFFSLVYENERIDIEDPTNRIPYKYFIKAYKKLLDNKNENQSSRGYTQVSFDKPKALLGEVQIVNTQVMNISEDYKLLFDVFKTDAPVIAFMRGIGHIVYYERYPINESIMSQTCYGVFRVDRKSSIQGQEKGYIDQYFRAIENQTHDKWEHREGTYPYNFLKKVIQKVTELVNNNCTFEIEEQKAQDISAVIQRTLGEKLLPYSSAIGGAKISLKESTYNEDRASIKKSTLSQTGNKTIELESGNKIISLEYKAKVRNMKKIHILSIKPGIKTIDPRDNSIIDTKTISFYRVQSFSKDGTTSIFVKDNFEIKQSQNIWVKLLCTKDCLFDIKINWEEVDE